MAHGDAEDLHANEEDKNTVLSAWFLNVYEGKNTTPF